MVEIFQNFYSPNNEIRENSHRIIFEQMENPVFIVHLFELLRRINKSEILLLKAVCITICDMLKMKWNEDFFDDKMKFQIFNLMIDAIFDLPFEVRPIIEMPLFSIFLQIKEFSDIAFNYCFLEEHQNSLFNVATSLSIVNQIVFIAAFIMSKWKIEAYTFSLLPFLQKATELALKMLQKYNSDNDDECVLASSNILEAVASILKNMVNKPKCITDGQQFLQLVSDLIEFLEFSIHLDQSKIDFKNYILNMNNEMMAIAHAKENICTLIINILFTKYDSLKQTFLDFFLEKLIKSIWICFLINSKELEISFSNEIDKKIGFDSGPFKIIQMKCLTVVEHLLSLNLPICANEFVNANFILNVVLPTCRLSNEDLITFTEIPEQFLNFCYNLEENSSQVSNRNKIARVLKIIGTKYLNFIDDIINICVNGVLNKDYPNKNFDIRSLTEYESRIYTISCFLEFRSEDLNLFHILMNIINQSNYPILLATALYALKSFKIEKFNLNKLSLMFLTQNNYIVIQILSIYLFKSTFDPLNTLIEIPLQHIISALLQITNVVKDQTAIQMIDLFICQYPELLLPLASELIFTLTAMYINLIGTIDEEDGRTILNLIIRMIQNVPFNSDILINISNFLIDFCCKALYQFPHSSYLSDFFDIILRLIEKIDLQNDNNSSSNFYGFISILINFIQSNFEEEIAWVSELSSIFIELIKKKNFIYINDGIYIQEIITFCDFVIKSAHNTNAVSSALFVLSSIVQIGKQSFVNLVYKSLPILSLPNISEEPNLFISAFCLFFSGIIADSSIIPNILNQEIYLLITNNYAIFIKSEYNYIIPCFIGLTILCKNGFEEAYNGVISLLPILLKKKREEELEEKDYEPNFEHNFITDQYCDGFIDIPFVSLPSDSINPFKYFYEFSQESDFFNRLSPETQQYIATHIFVSDLLN